MTTLPASSQRAVGRIALVAGIAYTAAWLAGLAVAAAGTDVTSTGADVVASIAGHESATAIQFLLTEIVAGVALALTVLSVSRHLRERRLGLVALAASVISVGQGVLGLVLSLVAVPDDRRALAGGLFETINRLDGVKMLVLAAMAVLGLLAGRDGRLPRWLAPVAVLLAVTIFVSGVGYLLLVPSLALAAYASLPLLLLWVTGAGVAVARRQPTED